MLRSAARHESLDRLGIEGHVIRAKARLYLGMMALDGDGCEQDDDAALSHFAQAAKAARAGLAKCKEAEAEELACVTASPPDFSDATVQDDDEYRFYVPPSAIQSRARMERAFGTLLKQLLSDAEEGIQGLEGPTPRMYRNA